MRLLLGFFITIKSRLLLFLIYTLKRLFLLHCIGISTANPFVLRTATYIQTEVHIQLHRLAHALVHSIYPLSHLFSLSPPGTAAVPCLPVPPLFPVARAQTQTSASSLRCLYLYRGFQSLIAASVYTRLASGLPERGLDTRTYTLLVGNSPARRRRWLLLCSCGWSASWASVPRKHPWPFILLRSSFEIDPIVRQIEPCCSWPDLLGGKQLYFRWRLHPSSF